MTNNRRMPKSVRLATTLLLCGKAALLAGCSQDFASVDDAYVPVLAEERFPIEVTDKPFKLSVSARAGNLANEDINRLQSFARAAQSDGASPVIVSYPSGSTKAKGVSQQAVQVLTSQGLDQSRIRTTIYTGKTDVVALSFTRKTASTKECGDWSENLANNAKNEPYPNYGCFLQNNLAAMVTNPEDFIAPATPGASTAASRTFAIERHQSGEWTSPANSDGADIIGTP